MTFDSQEIKGLHTYLFILNLSSGIVDGATHAFVRLRPFVYVSVRAPNLTLMDEFR